MPCGTLSGPHTHAPGRVLQGERGSSSGLRGADRKAAGSQACSQKPAWLRGSLVKVGRKSGCRPTALCRAESPLGPFGVVALWSWDLGRPAFLQGGVRDPGVWGRAGAPGEG